MANFRRITHHAPRITHHNHESHMMRFNCFQAATPHLQPDGLERAPSSLSDPEGSKQDRGLSAIKFEEADIQNAAMVPHLMTTLISHMNFHSR
jgi:hypothetical protein